MALTLSLSASQDSQSIANNTSTVTVTVKISWTYGSWDGNKYAKSVTIAGTKYTFDSVIINPNKSTSGSQTLYTKTVTVAHKADGTGSVAISASVKTATSSGTVTKSMTKTLTTIPRKSEATLSAASVATGGTITVNTNRKASSFTHTITLSLGGQQPITASSVGASYTFTIPAVWATLMPNSTSATAKMTCTTYSGSTNVGSMEKTFTVTVNAGLVPAITGVTAKPYSTNATVNGWGIYLQGYSSCEITAYQTNVSSLQGAQISAFEISYSTSASTSSPYRTPVFTASGEQTVYCRVKDSRGRWSAKYAVKVSVSAYSAPSLKGANAYRSDEKMNANDSGNRITVEATALGTVISGKNTLSLKARMKLKSSGSWGAYVNIGSGVKTLFDTVIAITSSYDVEITVSDTLGRSYTAAFSIGTKIIAINARHYSEKSIGIGIGKYSETADMVEVALGLKVKNVDFTITDAEYNNLISILGGV